MENFQKSLTGSRLVTTLNSFRETIILDYSVRHLGDAFYLTLSCGSFVPEILITSLVSLRFVFNSVSIDEKKHDCLRLLFYIDSKDVLL